MTPGGTPGADGGGSGREASVGRDRSLPPTCVPDERGSCSICGDEGLVAEVVEAAGSGSEGRVRLEAGEDAGRELPVALDLVPMVEEGDRVLVHMGFAIGRVREEG